MLIRKSVSITAVDYNFFMTIMRKLETYKQIRDISHVANCHQLQNCANLLYKGIRIIILKYHNFVFKCSFIIIICTCFITSDKRSV